MIEESARPVEGAMSSAIETMPALSNTHSFTRFTGRYGDQAVFVRLRNGSFLPPAFQAGGSLAGKDSRDASSTMSSTSSWGGGSLESRASDCSSLGCFAMASRFYRAENAKWYRRASSTRLAQV